MFCNERLLSSTSDSVLCAIVLLTEGLVLQHPEKMPGQLTDQYLHSLLYTCCYHSYTVRKSGQQSVKKMVSGLAGLSLAIVMFNLLTQLLDQQNWTEVSATMFLADSQRIAQNFMLYTILLLLKCSHIIVL